VDALITTWSSVSGRSLEAVPGLVLLELFAAGLGGLGVPHVGQRDRRAGVGEYAA
jgi:hypothetical protein